MIRSLRPLGLLAGLASAVPALAQAPAPVEVQPPTGFVAPNAPPSLAPVPAAAPSADPMALVPCPPAPTATAPKFDAVWNNGLFIQTPNKDFVAHIGGTVHADGAWYTGGKGVQTFPGGTGRFNDGANFRRIRFFMEGSMYKNIDYKVELEFENGIGFSPAGTQNAIAAGSVTNSPGPTDAWITVKDVPLLGNIRIGSQKEWFSLEHLNNYKYLEFMERSYLFDFSQPTAFNNGFSPGISTFRTWADDRIFTAIGGYKNESDLLGFGVGDGQYAVTGRVAGLPIWMPDDKFFWHVGGAMSHRDPVNGQVQIRIRNEVRNAPFPLLNLVANTGLVNSSSQTLYNLETAAVYGPLTIQAEYTQNMINDASVGTGPNVGTLSYSGFYAEAMFFLTGESRTWDPKIGIFKRVIPLNNFAFGQGTGAWEVAARYTYLDLNDKGINGGRLNDVTFGLNWYLNPNTKLQFNYDYLYRDGNPNPDAKGSIHSLGTRLAVDF